MFLVIHLIRTYDEVGKTLLTANIVIKYLTPSSYNIILEASFPRCSIEYILFNPLKCKVAKRNDDMDWDDSIWEDSANPEVNKDSGNCYRYARFMHRLSHAQADFVFWFLFFFQIICLVVIVQLYDSVQKKYM